MNVISRFKHWFIGALALTFVIVAYLVYALAGLNAKPVTYSEPPLFVQEYIDTLEHPNFSQIPQYTDYLNGNSEQLNEKKITVDYSKETALLHRVIFEDESPEMMLRLFAHPDKKIRVRLASAFGQMNVQYSHNDESGYPDKRQQFWVDWEDHLPNLENALFEALITTAQEDTQIFIPYTLAWMPTQDQDTVEMLTWAAEHHPDPRMRRFSVYFVVKFGNNEKFAEVLLDSRINDPAYIVRKEVLDLKYQRLIGEI